MPLISWGPQIVVGHPEIDSQHRKLIRIINDLHDAMAKGRGKEVLGRSLVELDEYTRYHFGTEEAVMDENAYNGASGHKLKHRELAGQLATIMTDYRNGKLTVTMETMDFLRVWLTDHIMGMDKKLSQFLSTH